MEIILEIEQTPLYRLAKPIWTNGPTSTNYTWKLLIHYGPTQTYEPILIQSINWNRNYLDNYADEVTCTVQIPLGVFAKLIYPHRTELQITLTKLPLNEMGQDRNLAGNIESERYSAILIDADRAATIAQGTEAVDQDSLDLKQIVNISFQLYDKALEQLRTMLVGGVYRTCTVKDALLTAMSNQSQAAVVDGNKAVIGIDMIEPNNTDLKGQIVITHGTKLIDFPDYIQSRIGIYNSGLGHYIQNKYWYCYPLYDTTQFNKRSNTVTFIILPKRKFSNIERTFLVQGNNVTILITEETWFSDHISTNKVALGNGVRFSDASTLMDGTSTADNKTSIARDSNNSEFTTGVAINGVDHAPVLGDRITANPFAAYSMMAARAGGAAKLIWGNSDHTLLTPGMPAKIVYDVDGVTSSIYGVLLGCVHVSNKSGGYGTNRYSNKTVVSLFVNDQVSIIET